MYLKLKKNNNKYSKWGKKQIMWFVYLDYLDILIQGVESNKCLYKIINHCNQIIIL